MGTAQMIEHENNKISSGRQFGRWMVIGGNISAGNGERKWLCRCVCGTERYVLERSLLYGGSLSCGCLRKEKALLATSYDLTGKQFGELTVIKKLGTVGKDRAIRWLCKCSCGAEYEVPGTLLKTGKRTHCSADIHKKNAYKDVTGEKFGRLTALYVAKRYAKGGSVIWHCKCDCGNEVDVSYNSLMYSNLKSCGCQKKEHDQKLASYLTHVAGTSIDMLKSKKIPTDNTTGYKGVYFVRGKYIAKIVFQKKQYFLGTYDDIEGAAEARREAEKVLFDDVAEHYSIWKQKAEQDSVWAEGNPIKIVVTQKNKKLSVIMLPVLE